MGYTLTNITNTNKVHDGPPNQVKPPKKVLDRDDFMLLFVKQLEYQDPMHPLENNEMAMQLALFNQLDELYSLNEQMRQFLNIYRNDANINYASLVGKLVEVEGNIGRIEEGKFLGAKIIANDDMENVKIKIYDEEGNLVKTIDMGILTKGEHELEWDGSNDEGKQLADGNYIINVEYQGQEDKEGEEPYKITVKGRVTGVTLGESEIKIQVNDNFEVNFEEIYRILEGGLK